ncbi:RagB/SusD family nutrient uptake outer membrane protein [Arachidicoccus soli]|uniref:RagB/SusD family nutrient uptake outer membrane protein n=1 Tax=Arachidicoccus soli TaxID=2341117 RepID=A0A386HKG3_9BACT|nr:RagB/SusD family nutrient uptake outer membrane protein [Arachidicoccus soli]AYD46377.1 RagB/SusD family nutrient uptake outer membrane protein [Arachidicoccus soli]
MKHFLFFKKLLIIFLISIALLGITSCNKQLHEGPIGSTYSSEFWTSQTAADEATAAMYGQLRASLRASSGSGVDQGEACYFVYGDLVSDLFRYAGGDTFLQYGLTSDGKIPWNFSYVPYWNNLTDWSRFYQVIALCNLIIENVNKMNNSLFTSVEKKNAYVAEALFVRAYTYFFITRVWGDPVYVAKTYNDVDYGHIPPIPRSPENQVLDSCIRDLRIADANLDYANGDITQSVTANKGSVEALMAHIFEWQHNYDSAHYYCQQVINNGGYSLEPMSTYKNIWKGESSNESIFEISMQYNANDPNFNSQGSFAEATFSFFGGFLKGAIVNQRRTSCWIAPTGGLVDAVLFDTSKDLRAKSILSYQQASGGDPAGYMLTKYSNFQTTATSSPYINNNLVIFRLSDIYLLDAEALAYKGDLTGAANDLKMTEDRAGINNYQSISDQYNMLDEVVMERGRELIGEGQWFYDLIRTNQTQQWLQYINYPSTRVNTTNKGYYWPIDMSTLFPYDNLLTQNPWWNNNSGR